MSYNPNNPNGQATSANSAPVVIASDQSAVKVNGSAVTQPVSGTVAVSNFPATQPVSGSVAVSGVSGNVTVVQPTGANLNVAVSNFPATQPVSGTVAVSSLPSIPTGSNAIGSVSVSNFPATQAISAASLPLPTGAATAAGLTTINTTLGSPLQAGGSVSVSNFPATQAISAVSLPPPSNILATGTLTGTGQTVNLTLNGTASVNIDVSGSGFVGTLQVVENTPSSARVLGVFSLNSSPVASSITTNGNYRVVGLPTSATITVQFSAYTSGSATINIYGSTAPYIVQPYSANAANVLVTSYLNDGSGNAISSNMVASQQALLTQNVANLRQTYSVGVGGTTFGTIAGAPTDVFILNGSATKVIRVINVQFAMSSTTAVAVPVQLIVRSTANTGGSGGSGVVTPHDSNNSATTTTNTFYAANPTLGTQTGTMVRSAQYYSSSTTVAGSPTIQWSLGQDGGQPIVLRGTAQGMAINLNGTTISGGKIDISVTWTEDTN